MSLYVFRTFWHTRAICVVFSYLKDSSWSENGIVFSCDYFLQYSKWIDLSKVHGWTSFFDDEVPSRPSLIDGIVNSIVIWKFCARTDIARSSCDLSWNEDNLRHFTVKKIVCVGSHNIRQSPKEGIIDWAKELLKK